MDKVYVLYLEMYHEWADENGSCDMLGVYKSIESVNKKIDEYTQVDKDNDYILEDYRVDGIGNIVVYANRNDYDNGWESAVYTVIETTVKD